MATLPDTTSGGTKEVYVPTTIWRRQISEMNPRRPWRAYSQAWKVINDRREYRHNNSYNAETLTEDQAVVYAIDTLLFMDRTFQSIMEQGWELYKEPLVVEFSKEDLLDTSNWNTPNALIRRILRSRKAHDFSDDLFATKTSSAV